MKIKKHIIGVLDTETCDLIGGVYDIALVIADRKGNILDQKNYLVSEIVTDAKKMMGAYYAGKTFSHYIPHLDQNRITLKSWDDIRKEFNDILEHYGCNIVAAYNLGFDSRAIGNTHQHLSGTKKWLRKNYTMLCLWEFACLTIFRQANYKNCARSFGWISEAGNIRTTAEHAYKYISTNLEHIENHTALQDALEEAEIMARCYATRKGKIPYNILNGKTWRHVNNG